MIPTEEEEQTILISWCRLQEGQWPELELIYHVPNEGKRSKRTAAAEKAMGLRAGVADLCLPVARQGWHGMYLEMKALDGKVTKEQKRFLAAVKDQGYFGCVCYGAEAATGVIRAYMESRLEPGKLPKGVEIF